MSLVGEFNWFSIQSDYFNDNSTKFQLFNKEVNERNRKEFIDRIALVYGRNGSGKSTISRGFSSITNDDSDIKVKLYNSDSRDLLSISEEETNVYVFNEDYIDKKVRVDDSGMESVILLGEQVDLDDQIEKIVNDLKELNKGKKVTSKKIEIYNDTNNTESYLFYHKKMVVSLRNRWANKDSLIKGHRQNSAVTDFVLKSILELEVEESEENLRLEFKKNIELFSNTPVEANIIQGDIPRFLIDIDQLQSNVAEYLNKILTRVELTERENKILDIIDENYHKLTNVKEYINNESEDYCKTCLQPISIKYKTDLLSDIEKILNEELKEFVNQINQYKIKEIDLADYSIGKEIDEGLYNKLIVEIIKVNELINEHNQNILEKISNPYNQLSYKMSLDLTQSVGRMNSIAGEIENKRIDYNKTILDRDRIKEDLILLNKKIAYKELLPDYIQFIDKNKHLVEAVEEAKRISDEIDQLERSKIQIEEQLKNTTIAVDDINKSLRYIFYSNTRIQLELGDDSLYHLKINGQSVLPTQVSCGERNAIALSYFFTEISKGLKADEMYSKSSLIVLDDPISSFDHGNRVGIVTFLKMKIEKVLIGNLESKIIILTHDISTMFDIKKASEEIVHVLNEPQRVIRFNSYLLKDKKLEKFTNNYNEYTNSLQTIYVFAQKSPGYEELESTIGNILRRMLEGFSTFSYKKGISELSTDQRILECMPEEYRDYFKLLMYRLVLNSESHFQENVQGNPEDYFFSVLELEEKVKTAKDVISLLYLLNKEHLLSHIVNNSNYNNIDETIGVWLTDILNV